MKILMEQWKKYLTEGEDKAIWKGYLGWKVPADKVSLDGVDQKYIDNRITRDGGDSFHITIFTPPEVRDLIKDLREKAKEEQKEFSESQAPKAVRDLIKDLRKKAEEEKKEISKSQATKAVKEKLMADAANLSPTYKMGDTKSAEGPGDGAVGTKGADSIAFFKVIDWNEAQELRKSYGLQPKDFHITLGIGDNGDVHGVDKT